MIGAANFSKKFTMINSHNAKVDRSTSLKAYRKSHKVGDLGYYCMGDGGVRMECKESIIHRHKYNRSVFYNYINEWHFDQRIQAWHKDND